MRLPLAAACAALALVPAVPADAVGTPSVAAVPFASTGITGGPYALAGLCSFDGAVLVAYAHSFAVPQTDALDINVSCTLTDYYGNVLAHAAGGAATPPAVGAAVAVPGSTPHRLCGRSSAYFRGGRSLTASGCGNALPGPR